MNSFLCHLSPCKISQTGVFGVKLLVQGGGGGLPPESVTPFSLKKKSVKGRRGGTPLTDKIRKVIFDPLPYCAAIFTLIDLKATLLPISQLLHFNSLVTTLPFSKLEKNYS